MLGKIRSVFNNLKKLTLLPDEISQLRKDLAKEEKKFVATPAKIEATLAENTNKKLTSSLCKEIDFHSGWYAKWCKELKITPALHRKQWEYAYICQVLFERSMLKSGKKGLGFAVGTEPLPSLFAKLGCQIVATDISPDEGEKKGWAVGDQLCYGLEGLNKMKICSDDILKRNVTYREVDMNKIPSDLQNFDFNWSSCSMEHLGSIVHGLTFLQNQLKTLKPGGIAVHTTEYNISSDTDTFESEGLSIFRQKDILKVIKELEAEGHTVETPDFSIGWMPTDYVVDIPPYSQDPHLRLQLFDYVSTSIGLIIKKSEK